MHATLVKALVGSENEAADELLLEGLKIGTAAEQSVVLDALLVRKTTRGLAGVVQNYDALPPTLQTHVLDNIRMLYSALRECGRSDNSDARLASMKLIALSRQGKLAYVLSENLHDPDEVLSKAAVEALVALSRWVATSTRRLQRDYADQVLKPLAQENAATPADSEKPPATTAPVNAIATAKPTPGTSSGSTLSPATANARATAAAAAAASGARSASETESPSATNAAPTGASPADKSAPLPSSSPATLPEALVDLPALYREIIDQRAEIETTVARALDIHRGKHSPDLLRAALLLCDWPKSKTLAILQTPKHGGQSPMVRRLQQPPASEHVEAFLLGASHGQLRVHFGVVFSHITEAPVLDALLRKTHWLKDHQLQLCMHQVTRGTWWQEADLVHDMDRREPEDAARIAEWLAVSGMHDVMQDERFMRIAEHVRNDFGARLRLLRIAIRRKKGASVQFLRQLLADTDERLIRMAAREIVRRRPADFENMLLQLMTNAPESVRRVVSRSIGQAGFENYWQRFDRLDKPTRRGAGRAMMKLLPDATIRLARRLNSGPIEQRLKAMQMAHELGVAEQLIDTLKVLANHPHPRVRSKAVSVLGELPSTSMETLLERVLNDSDSRVRANAVEVLEAHPTAQFLPLLAQRARNSHNRERANAIKALHTMKVGNVGPQLLAMLQDERPEHRISAMWALKQIGWWKLLQQVGKLAKDDNNLRVRRYAVGVIKNVAEMVQNAKAKAG
jgi:HEAT repeat protein